MATEAAPVPSHPSWGERRGFVHRRISIRGPDAGLTLHYVEVTRASIQGKGSLPGPAPHVADGAPCLTVLMVHGWPELWFSWRHQAAAIAAAGHRVLVPDLVGYGGSSSPTDKAAYTHRRVCGDMLELMDATGTAQCVAIGHDWGGAIVWELARHHPHRVLAVCGINTAFMERTPVSPLDLYRVRAGRFAYQLWFQQDDGSVERQWEANMRRNLRAMMRGTDSRDTKAFASATAAVAKSGAGVTEADLVSTPQERGGMFVGLPDELPRSVMWSKDEEDVYVHAFERRSFRGPLNWYRNLTENWEWEAEVEGKPVEQPALMITAGRDGVLTPRMSKGMEKHVPLLQRAHLEHCGHWTMQERSVEVCGILVAWLARTVEPHVARARGRSSPPASAPPSSMHRSKL